MMRVLALPTPAPVRAVASRHALAVVEDCCQAHLATYAGQPVGAADGGGALSFDRSK